MGIIIHARHTMYGQKCCQDVYVHKCGQYMYVQVRSGHICLLPFMPSRTLMCRELKKMRCHCISAVVIDSLGKPCSDPLPDKSSALCDSAADGARALRYYAFEMLPWSTPQAVPQCCWPCCWWLGAHDAAALWQVPVTRNAACGQDSLLSGTLARSCTNGTSC